MTVYAILDDQQRVTMWSTSQFADAKAYEIDDYDHFYNASFCYYLKDEKLIYDDSAKVKAEKQEKILMQISELKQLLTQSDYKALKYAEGWLSAEDFKETLDQRQLWRNQINELESELESL